MTPWSPPQGRAAVVPVALAHWRDTVQRVSMEQPRPFDVDAAGVAPRRSSFTTQAVEHSPGFFQVARVEAFRKPTVDRGEKFSGLISLPLIAPQPR